MLAGDFAGGDAAMIELTQTNELILGLVVLAVLLTGWLLWRRASRAA
jgi:hypothetical protein